MKTVTCTVCDKSYTEDIPKLTTHSYDNGVTLKYPTCNSMGTKTYTCTVCGETKTETIPVREDHGLEKYVQKSPDCGETGIMCYYCVYCDYTYTEEIPMLTEHSYSDGVCTVCGGRDPDYVEPTEPEPEPTEPGDPGEDKDNGGFFAAIAAFFEAIFRVLFWFLYL